MSIRYVADRGKYGDLCVYEGESSVSGRLVYTIEEGTIYGTDSFYLRDYPSGSIAFTVMPSKTNPGDYLVYEGSSPMHGTPIPYYVQRAKPYTVIRAGDSIGARAVMRVREGSVEKYIIEDEISSPWRKSSTGGYTDADRKYGLALLVLIVIAAFGLLIYIGGSYNPGVLVLLAGAGTFCLTMYLKKRFLYRRKRKK